MEKEQELYEAELVFSTRELAEEFVKAYSRRTLRGHTMTSGTGLVKVQVYGLNQADMDWINGFVKNTD